MNNTSHVSEYSEDGKLFALLNVNGELKIWDTETSECQKEFVPNHHLNAPFTCFTWITVNGSSRPRKVKICFSFVSISYENRHFIKSNTYLVLLAFQTPHKKNANQGASQYIALGTRNGGVTLYSLSKGVVGAILK